MVMQYPDSLSLFVHIWYANVAKVTIVSGFQCFLPCRAEWHSPDACDIV